MAVQKILFLSENAYIGDIAWRVSEEGYDVRYHISNPHYRDSADGFVAKSQHVGKDIEWADLIVFEGGEQGDGLRAEQLRNLGKLVVGGTRYSDRLEFDRAFGQQELKRLGIAILPYKTFNSFDDAIHFVARHPGCYVIKPDGKMQDDKTLLYVGDDPKGQDIIELLETYKCTWKDHIQFQLQQKAMGVEIGIGAFYNGSRFIYPVNVNFEHKRLFPGEIGPTTIEMGSSMFWSNKVDIFDRTLLKMESNLQGYVGYVDINCIVDKDGIHPLEFTPRFGYPTIGIQYESMAMPLGQALAWMAEGKNFQLEVKKGFAVGIRVAMPPYPFGDDRVFEKYTKGVKIRFKTADRAGYHIEDVKLVNGEWIITGDVGAVLLVTGSGRTMRAAKQAALKRIDNLILPNMYYRNDIGDRWYSDIKKLHSWGYLL